MRFILMWTQSHTKNNICMNDKFSVSVLKGCHVQLKLKTPIFDRSDQLGLKTTAKGSVPSYSMQPTQIGLWEEKIAKLSPYFTNYRPIKTDRYKFWQHKCKTGSFQKRISNLPEIGLKWMEESEERNRCLTRQLRKRNAQSQDRCFRRTAAMHSLRGTIFFFL